MQEAVAATTEHVNIYHTYEGTPAVRCGFRHGGRFVATWRCKDGYVSITTHRQQAWDDLRAWMAEAGMAGDLMDEKYSDTFVLRGENSAHIEGLIEKWAMRHTRQEIPEWGQARHYPFGLLRPGGASGVRRGLHPTRAHRTGCLSRRAARCGALPSSEATRPM